MLMEDLDEIESLCQPISQAHPTGRDLEEGLDLNALENAVSEPEEPSIQGVVASDNRNWRGIARQARGLLGESKDLRVAVIYAQALLRTHGVPGLAQGLHLCRALLEQYWTELYPRIDEDGDPQLRINVLSELWSRQTLSELRSSAAVELRGVGAFTVNDVLVFKQSPLGRAASSKASPSEVRNALDNAEPDAFAQLRAAIEQAREDLRGVGELIARTCNQYIRAQDLTAASGSGSPGILDALSRALAEHARDAKHPQSAGADATDTAPTRAAPSDLETRDDVLRMLDRICDFYAQREPSSPVPLMLKRTKRMVSMDFVELVRDLADQGMQQVEVVLGLRGEP